MYSVNETFRAMGRVLARQAQQSAREMDADGVIEAAALLKPWQAGQLFEANEVRTHAHQPWKCLQPHTGQTGWEPGQAPSLWAPFHARSRAHALPFVSPTHAGDAYQTGEWMIFTDGRAYRALRDAVDRGPDELPQSWEAEDESH